MQTGNHEMILVIDFGGQYIQLIARAVREQNVYCEIMPWRAGMDKIRAYGAKGIILSGGPHSVYEENAPQISDEIFSLGVPVLGICYGMQYIAHRLGGVVRTAPVSEYGKQYLNVNQSELFSSVKQNSVVWMSHCDYISEIPAGFRRTATTPTCPVAALECVEKKIYGVQFHPEVNHTEYGRQILKNFLYSVCKIEERWSIGNFVTESVEKIRKKVGDGKVLCALSGGVDSAACVLLLQRQGYDVSGVTLRLHHYKDRPGTCGSADDIEEAARVAAQMGISHRVLDLCDLFRREVMGHFVSEYCAGRTPNPCLDCNRELKFGAMLDWALDHGFDYVSTGHYARVGFDAASGRHLLLRGVDALTERWCA